MTARGTWKHFELRTARDHGTERIPVNGRHGPDWENDALCAQCKLRKGRPAFLTAWIDEINGHAHARDPRKVGLVIWRTPGEEHGDAVVLLRYSDWLRVSGQATTAAT